jgi:osmoprotectant transport system ATP-binding protein
MVLAQRVCKDFGALKVLKGVDIEVGKGQVLVIVGPSGSGKSTFLRCINHLENISAGRLYVDGELVGYREARGKLHELPPREAAKQRRDVGMVFQHFNLFPHRTALENIIEAPIHVKKVKRKEAVARAKDLLDQVELAEKAEAYPAQLSGGEQQRVGVARALAADPPILLMDEPFSAVDPIVRHELQREILRLQAELHKTIVFVTHDIDEALRLADRVAVFGRGGVLQQYDEPARLLSRPANDFVSKMIGAGRGYRWLQFLGAANLPLHDIPTITDSAAVSEELLRDGWALVVDPDGAPLGWIDVNGVRKHRGGASLDDSVTAVGAVFRPGANLSQALDAALSSPAAMGVAVDGAGKVTGGVSAGDVLAALDSHRRD